jgi:hypothetical protein
MRSDEADASLIRQSGSLFGQFISLLAGLGNEVHKSLIWRTIANNDPRFLGLYRGFSR